MNLENKETTNRFGSREQSREYERENTATASMYQAMGISPEIYAYGKKTEEKLRERFRQIDETAEYNQLKVVAAMQKNRISAEHFNGSSGYGYNDIGRDDLEKVYADTFHTESALVRPQIACGTHALAVALAGNLRPGDEMLSVSGKPYDTLEEVIGIRPSNGSLAEYGVSYGQVELLPLSLIHISWNGNAEDSFAGDKK